jgi:hypothetical protein
VSDQTLEIMRQAVSGKKQSVCFAFFTAKDWLPYYQAFSEFLDQLEASHYGILIIAEDGKIDTETKKQIKHRVYTVDRGLVSRLNFVDVFLTIDWNPLVYDFPDSSKVVAFTHFFSTESFADQLTTCCGIYGGDFTDFHFISAPKGNDEVSKLHNRAQALCSESFPAGLRRKRSCVIPGGYPKLDTYIATCRNRAETDSDKTLLFAVTGLVNEDKTLPVYGKKIIKILLENFPDYWVVFRPTPIDREHIVVQELVDCFSSNARFKVDLGGDLSHTYATSSLMICDRTNARTTYAYSTLRPYLQCCFGQESKDAIEHIPLGIIVYNINNLVETINILLKNRDSYQNQIQEDCEENLANQGNSLAYLADNFNYITEGIEHPDWFYIDKAESEPRDSESVNDYLKHISRFNDQSVNYIWWSRKICLYALKQFPNDVSLLATYAKIMFMMGDDNRLPEANAEALKARDRAYALDKGTAARHIWTASERGGETEKVCTQLGGGGRYHCRALIAILKSRVLECSLIDRWLKKFRR